MEVGDLLERIIKPFSKERKVVDFESQADAVFSEAWAWVADSLAKSPQELGKQPFLLNSPEIDTIDTRLTEIKSKEILDKRKFKKAQKQEIEQRLNSLFSQHYEEIIQKMITDNQLGGITGIRQVCKNYLEIVKSFAPKFAYNESSDDELIKICNEIRLKQAATLIIGPINVNS